MAGKTRRLRPVLGLVAAIVVSIGWAATPAPADAALPSWHGYLNLYRAGVFSTQKSWLWCTAADVQMMRNIKYHRAEHDRAIQSRYFEWMRGRNRYSLPRSAGVDPQGWTAGLRRYVDDRYRLVASTTFTTALRQAVTNMRKTNLPVAVAVSRGNHGWVLHGFTATADPAKTSTFTVTSVRVSGPLWGLQNSTFGYDMRPNTKLTVSQFQRFFTKWWYSPKRMIWDNKFVSIQPVPRSTSTSTAGAGAATSEPAKPAASAIPTAAAALPPIAGELPASPVAATPNVVRAAPSTEGSRPTPFDPMVPILLAAVGALIAIAMRIRLRWTRPPTMNRRPTS